MSFQDRAFSAEPPPTTGGPSFAEGEAVDLLHAHGDETSDDPTESAFREKLLDLERRLTDLQDQVGSSSRADSVQCGEGRRRRRSILRVGGGTEQRSTAGVAGRRVPSAVAPGHHVGPS
ncbi:MAG: uncharacterized protein KVP18_002965 [Porospora cf. gigantea A]|uniref:uncharacterized protein n=1 Tax=Porospora cf. gigantea A TaxID=2853593 RepID=UPI00355A12E8|nr:MAG: hypothetical protein KVP18_002965 [Porospora cf. gigantea A]